MSEHITIGNEFTSVRVRKALTRNGERLEITSAKLGTKILLDPLELEGLTWQDTETFSRMLEQPYGPEQVDSLPLSELVSSRQRMTYPDHPPA